MKILIFYGIIGIIAVFATALLSDSFWFILYTCTMLVLFEVALGFDNAVVNARVLTQLSPKWQTIFLTWGIFVAVFVVRFCLPILLVYLTSSYSIRQILALAMNDPVQYGHILHEGYPIISGFGGGFLIMVWLSFLGHQSKVHHWLPWIEKWALWQKGWWHLLILLLVGGGFAVWSDYWLMLVAFAVGVLLQWGVNYFRQAAAKKISLPGGIALNAGILGFIYLELLDASFSLDSVLGAFAISENIVVIMVGLGCGALCIRALTIEMVKHKTLYKWRYLEHGAHYAIGILAIILLLKNVVPVPEWIAGTVSLVIILLSVLHSYRRPAIMPSKSKIQQ